ncbi:MAG TPA: hypothetical protein VIA18_30595, partial [Polyangia bacterium]|nr:hypothetical protein [Polyangia bacterium]
MPRLCAVVVCLTTMMTAAAAAELPRYDISVRVDAETRQVSGHARIVVTNNSDAAVRELDLWRYPERFAVRSKALNDYNFYWIYPTRFNAGHMRTGPVVVDGRAVSVDVRDDPRAGPGTLLAVALEPPLQPGAHVTVDVDFSDVVPERYGSFGCVGGDCTLVGFYPLVREPGQPDDGEPGRGDYRVTVSSAHTADVTVNGELRAITPRVGATEYRVGVAPGLTLTVGRPALRRYE